MSINRLSIPAALALGLFLLPSGASAGNATTDDAFSCASLCPGASCPETCKKDKSGSPGKKHDYTVGDGPGNGAYEAAKPQTRTKLDPDK